MKYQIYLNKETSEFINRMAEIRKIKPATQVKELVEQLAKKAIETYKVAEKDWNERILSKK